MIAAAGRWPAAAGQWYGLPGSGSRLPGSGSRLPGDGLRPGRRQLPCAPRLGLTGLVLTPLCQCQFLRWQPPPSTVALLVNDTITAIVDRT